MPLVAGVDTSTQSCKVVIRDADTGALRRFGAASHPDATEVDPEAWWTAFQQASTAAGGLDDVAALSVGGQQHGMVALDSDGAVVRDALLWNDTRSAKAARDLITELGDGRPGSGEKAWADAVGIVPVASFTITKLRWLAENEPANAERVEAVALPHDWLTWRIAGDGPGTEGLSRLITDRSDASGTGYFDGVSNSYRFDLLERGFGRRIGLPAVIGPGQQARSGLNDLVIGPGTGDNAGAALGLGARPGDVMVSIGTSGVVTAVSDTPTRDVSGLVAGFSDATGRYLPLLATINGSRTFDAIGRLLGVGHKEFAELALSAPPGAEGLVLVPYLEGERTPNLPDSTGSLHGVRLANTTPANLARAAVEGVLCSLAFAMDALVAQDVAVERIILIGGAAQSEAVRRIAPSVLGKPVVVPKPGEYVADGAARQAAWVLSGEDEAPTWELDAGQTYELEAPAVGLRERYAEASQLFLTR
ncbi:xylulokinase [Pseudactinotalea terrae]|uniref:xylulokinase n=1 Tax=Pseudactinotalea terrae TaxID=1743262 RepID=UPI0012E1F647|nr:FGGY-family carbohydrate kinase [Pseudactinotalea terrae]